MSDRPDPSWSNERMERYLQEKYGEKPRFSDARTGQPLTNRDLVELFGGKTRKEP